MLKINRERRKNCEKIAFWALKNIMSAAVRGGARRVRPPPGSASVIAFKNLIFPAMRNIQCIIIVFSDDLLFSLVSSHIKKTIINDMIRSKSRK